MKKCIATMIMMGLLTSVNAHAQRRVQPKLIKGDTKSATQSTSTQQKTLKEITDVSTAAKEMIIEAIGDDELHATNIRNLYYHHNTLVVRYQIAAIGFFGTMGPFFYVAQVDTEAVGPIQTDVDLVLSESVAEYLERALESEEVVFEDEDQSLQDITSTYLFPKGHDASTPPGFHENVSSDIHCNPLCGMGDARGTNTYDEEQDGMLFGKGE